MDASSENFVSRLHALVACFGVLPASALRQIGLSNVVLESFHPGSFVDAFIL